MHRCRMSEWFQMRWELLLIGSEFELQSMGCSGACASLRVLNLGTGDTFGFVPGEPRQPQVVFVFRSADQSPRRCGHPAPLRLPLRRLARWPNTMQRASAHDCPSPPSSARCDTLVPSTAQTGHGWASNGTIRHAANTLAVTTASTTFKRGTPPPQRLPVLRPPSRVSLVF
jgi:hypothetical protein